MPQLIVINADSRREMCLQCEYRHDFTIAGDKGEDVFLCKERFRSSCSMKAALRNPDAQCPNPNVEWSARWNLAKLDKNSGCRTEESEITEEERLRISQSWKKPARAARIGHTVRDSDAPVFKVYE